MARNAFQIDRILRALADGCATSPQIAKHAGINVSVASTRLNVMVKRGMVARAENMAPNGKSRPVVVWKLLRSSKNDAGQEVFLDSPDFPVVPSLTAAIFGDPPVGRSALDERMRGAKREAGIA